MREVVCRFDDWTFAALENAAQRLGNSIENIIEFAVVEAVTGREVGDHIEEQTEDTEDFSPPVDLDTLYRKPGMYGGLADIAEQSSAAPRRADQGYRTLS